MHADSIWSETAAWVEALGAIGAVIGSGWVAASESRATRGREERSEAAARRREQQSELATRNAALNLAILASTQIHDLHVLLQDDVWRGRVARVSASRALLVTQQMLIAFPLHTLTNAQAMLAFSRFPGALATAAEVYGNLERAVRAVGEAERGAIFDQYNAQMERLDKTAADQLGVLRTALDLDPAPPSPALPPQKGEPT